MVYFLQPSNTNLLLLIVLKTPFLARVPGKAFFYSRLNSAIENR